MGAGSSKPGEGGGGGAAATSSKHVFASETPVQFSQEIVDALQASAEVSLDSSLLVSPWRVLERAAKSHLRAKS